MLELMFRTFILVLKLQQLIFPEKYIFCEYWKSTKFKWILQTIILICEFKDLVLQERVYGFKNPIVLNLLDNFWRI